MNQGKHIVIVVGCGGIAYQARSLLHPWLKEQVMKFGVDNVHCHYVDPDQLQPENLQRQWCNDYDEEDAEVVYKANLMADNNFAYKRSWVHQSKWADAVRHIEKYIGTLPMETQVTVTVFAWPDNNECRYEIEETMREWASNFSNLWIRGVTGGNSDREANAFGLMIKDSTLMGWGKHLETTTGVDTAPSCGQGNAQTPIANAMAAVMSFQLLEYLEKEWVEGDKWIGYYWSAERAKMYTQEVPSGLRTS